MDHKAESGIVSHGVRSGRENVSVAQHKLLACAKGLRILGDECRKFPNTHRNTIYVRLLYIHSKMLELR